MELLDVADVPLKPAAIDLITPYADLEARVLALATAKHGAPGLARILEANRTAAASKATTLAESFADVRKQLEAASNGSLAAEADVMGKPSTRRGVFTALIATIAEELGKAEAGK